MPVQDHPTDPRTKIGADHRAGCWNLPRTREPYPVKTGFKLIWHGFGSYESVQMFTLVKDTGSLPCMYDQATAPDHCEGCRHVNRQK